MALEKACINHLKSWDKRKKFFLDLEKTATVIEFPRLYENQIPSWISNRVKGYGKSIKGSYWNPAELGRQESPGFS